jgi:hypothetical protein
MRRQLFLAAMFLLVFLAACDRTELDYDDFSDRLVSTYFAAEHASDNRYVVYYFDSTDNESDTLKKEVLTLFDTFETLEFYLLDTADTGSEQSLFGGYEDHPVLHVISENEVLETRVGGDEILSLLREYQSISYDYDLFSDQHVTSIHEVYQVNQGDVLVYYYDPSEPIDESFLRWAFTKPAQRIHFVDKTVVEDSSTFPAELYRLQEGTPALFLMSGDQYANEMYLGQADIAAYVETVEKVPSSLCGGNWTMRCSPTIACPISPTRWIWRRASISCTTTASIVPTATPSNPISSRSSSR